MKKLIYIFNGFSLFLVFIQSLFLLSNKIFFTSPFYFLFYGIYGLFAVLGIVLHQKHLKLSLTSTFLGYCFLFYQIYALISL